MPVEHRPQVLRPLGLLIKPRNIGQQLCRDVLNRLSHADEHSARHATDALIHPITPDIAASHPWSSPDWLGRRLFHRPPGSQQKRITSTSTRR